MNSEKFVVVIFQDGKKHKYVVQDISDDSGVIFKVWYGGISRFRYNSYEIRAQLDNDNNVVWIKNDGKDKSSDKTAAIGQALQIQLNLGNSIFKEVVKKFNNRIDGVP
jgi:hypothetical protein